MRSSVLDIAKGLGIIAVVLGHNWASLHNTGKLFEVIFSFHMPLFFFLSGVLLRPSSDIKHIFGQRGVSLLTPYASTLLLLAIPLLIIGKLTTQYFIGAAYASGGTIPWRWAPLWFLPHLWLVGVAGFMVQRFCLAQITSTLVRVVLVICILVGGYFCMLAVKKMPFVLYGVSISENGLPLGIDFLGISLFYYALGFLARDHVRSFNLNGWAIALAASVFAAIHIYTNDTIDLNRRRYDDIFVCTAAALCGIYLCISASKLLAGQKLVADALSYVGRGSLFIFIFHFAIQNISYNALLYNAKMGRAVASIASFLLGVIVPLAIFEFVRRHKILRALWMPKAVS